RWAGGGGGKGGAGGAGPILPASSATAAPVTAGRCRRAHRRARREKGSRQAETGSSAVHRSTSSASARHEGERSSGLFAIALRQTASSALSIDRSSCPGGAHSPRWALAEPRAGPPVERGPAGQQAVQRGAQRVDVGPRPGPVEVAGRLLGAHVGGRPQRRAGERLGAAAGGAGGQRPLARGRVGI